MDWLSGVKDFCTANIRRHCDASQYTARTTISYGIRYIHSRKHVQRQTYYTVVHESDRLCWQYGLSVTKARSRSVEKAVREIDGRAKMGSRRGAQPSGRMDGAIAAS